MRKYEIKLFDIERGAPSATIADYGITLNAVATKLLASWRYLKIGYDKTKRLIILVPHCDKDVAGSINIADKMGNLGYLRINSRDFVRVVMQYCGTTLNLPSRCLAEWDEDEKVLVVYLDKVLENGSSKTDDQ